MHVLLKHLDPNGADFLLPEGNADYSQIHKKRNALMYWSAATAWIYSVRKTCWSLEK